MTTLVGYFDLNARAAKARSQASETQPAKMSPARQAGLYGALVLGVIFSTLVIQFTGGEDLTFTITGVRLAVALVIALAISPIAFQKLVPASPYLAQLGVFVNLGLTWPVVLQAGALVL